jgi:DNA-binding transcriptional ArsR family regulator
MTRDAGFRRARAAAARVGRKSEQVFSYCGRVSHGVQGKTHSGRLDAGTERQVAETMQALATPSRLRILSHLRDGACGVNELAEAVGMEASAVSHQLRVLRHLGLVVGERSGRRIVYELHDSHVGVLLEEAVYHVEHLRLGYSDAQRAKRAS